MALSNNLSKNLPRSFPVAEQFPAAEQILLTGSRAVEALGVERPTAAPGARLGDGRGVADEGVGGELGGDV